MAAVAGVSGARAPLTSGLTGDRARGRVTSLHCQGVLHRQRLGVQAKGAVRSHRHVEEAYEQGHRGAGLRTGELFEIQALTH